MEWILKPSNWGQFMPFFIPLFSSLDEINLKPGANQSSVYRRVKDCVFSGNSGYWKRMNERNIPLSPSGNCVFVSTCTWVSLCIASVFACFQASVMTGSALPGQIKMSSLSAHFHSHLSADLQEALKADMVHLFGPWWACLPSVDPVSYKTQPTHFTIKPIESVAFGSYLAHF